MATPLTIPLNKAASVVFDPDCRSGHLLKELANPTRATRLCGIAAKADTAPSEGEIIVGEMGEVTDLLCKARATFDLIASAPRIGKISAKGIPAAPRKKSATSAGRRILANDEAGSTEIDNGYACWCVANRLLSPLGEGMLLLPTDSVTLIDETAWAQRIWLRIAVSDKLTAVYFAADHIADIAAPAPTIEHTKDAAEKARIGRGKLIRGGTYSEFDVTTSGAQRFVAVREELRRRRDNKPLWNLLLNTENEVEFKFSAFQKFAEEITDEIIESAKEFHHRRMLDIAILADSRNRFDALIGIKGLVFHPKVASGWKETLRQAATLRCPLTRPTSAQRIAWLDETGTITCREDVFGANGMVIFRAGESYPIESKIFDGKKLERRFRPGIGPENVLVIGQELMLIITDTNGLQFGFTQFELSEEQVKNDFLWLAGRYRLNDLVASFQLPNVADIAASDQIQYETYVQRLHALETQ